MAGHACQYTQNRMKPAVFVLVFVVATALGRAETIGVDDLAEHIEAIVKQRPRDAAAHYTLGRAQAIAVERRIDKVEIADKLVAGKVPTLADDAQQPPATLPVAGEQITKFLNGAIVHVTKAVELARDEPRYRLAMAQLLDRAAPSAIDVDVLPRVVATPPPIMNAGQTERTTKFIEELNDDAKRDAAITELRKHLDEAAAMLHAHRKDGGDAAKQAVASLLEGKGLRKTDAAGLGRVLEGE